MRPALLRLALVALAAFVASPATAQRPEGVTICVTNRVPSPIPRPCSDGDGTWSLSGAVPGQGSVLEAEVG